LAGTTEIITPRTIVSAGDGTYKKIYNDTVSAVKTPGATR